MCSEFGDEGVESGVFGRVETRLTEHLGEAAFPCGQPGGDVFQDRSEMEFRLVEFDGFEHAGHDGSPAGTEYTAATVVMWRFPDGCGFG